ncbi:hypothetical protein ABT279_47395, partial [Amycolatopsis sp. NPDC000673]|uniref:hypothetical protein n=1 Tax=Amycolatopsis sp. NPDC000673 TaxID=3154267 RepID=UPI00332E5A42
LDAVREVVLGGFRHQDVPFDQVVTALRPLDWPRCLPLPLSSPEFPPVPLGCVWSSPPDGRRPSGPVPPG